MKIQVGIDLGTTNTVCCWIKDGKEQYVRFAGKDTLPSILMYTNNQVFIGDVAKRRSIQNPDNFIRSAKTYMGDESWVQEIDGRSFNATDVAVEILKYVREQLISSFHLDSDTEVEAVITVPAYFKAKQREETKIAGERAGLIVKSIIQEPVAAALADTASRQEEERIFVLDLGGGTFDVSILNYSPDSQESYSIEKIAGDSKLGGDNFDEEIKEWLFSKVAKETGVNLRDDQCGIQEINRVRERIHRLAEEIKIDLSMKEVAAGNLANLFAHDNGTYNLEVTMTREEFEEECSLLFKKIERTMQRALRDCSLEPDDIQRILLVGGSSQIPKIKEITKSLFDKDPHKEKDLSKIVAAGAALYASNHEGMVEKVANILPHSLGIEVTSGNEQGKMEIMLKRGSRYSTKKDKLFTTSEDYQDAIIINIFEGENDFTKDNEFFGSLILDGIEKAEKGKPRISISFMFDNDGILHVQAKDLNTNVEMNSQVKIDKQAPKVVAPTSTNIALMIDTSGSMKKDGKMFKAQQAAKTLVTKQLDLSLHYAAIVSFADGVKVESNFTQNSQQLCDAIDRLTPRGGTHLQVAFREMQEVFKKGVNSSNCAIMVTDGRTSHEKLAIQKAQELKDQGVRIVAIGVGSDVKMNYLMGIATEQSDCYTIANMDELTDIFAKVSSSLCVVKEAIG
ncbi:molecular chaperone DnaK [Ureibacillus xyleni]|uniref:Chaperone protein DnaK n=1 Tax=Ureibacillus xyleni TaxID=614648 RepID=A0A285SM64_9BACL|nr:Hsp70 family protein [Ureibacillus xyleni]SOC09109.1 molecular chaperone DnaK [Ureibacillus xyleni]